MQLLFFSFSKLDSTFSIVYRMATVIETNNPNHSICSGLSIAHLINIVAHLSIQYLILQNHFNPNLFSRITGLYLSFLIVAENHASICKLIGSQKKKSRHRTRGQPIPNMSGWINAVRPRVTRLPHLDLFNFGCKKQQAASFKPWHTW